MLAATCLLSGAGKQHLVQDPVYHYRAHLMSHFHICSSDASMEKAVTCHMDVVQRLSCGTMHVYICTTKATRRGCEKSACTFHSVNETLGIHELRKNILVWFLHFFHLKVHRPKLETFFKQIHKLGLLYTGARGGNSPLNKLPAPLSQTFGSWEKKTDYPQTDFGQDLLQ